MFPATGHRKHQDVRLAISCLICANGLPAPSYTDENGGHYRRSQ
jgi:hypothetical protein